VGHVVAHCVLAFVDVAVPQHTLPDGQSLAPSQLKAAVSIGHGVPWFTHLPVGLLFLSSPTQHVCVRRSQLGVGPHTPMLGAEASCGKGGGGPASRGLPASGFTAPELEPELDPEVDPEPEPEVDPELDPELDPEVDPDPSPLPVPSSPLGDDASSLKSIGPLALAAQAEATKADPATPHTSRSDKEAFDQRCMGSSVQATRQDTRKVDVIAPKARLGSPRS